MSFTRKDCGLLIYSERSLLLLSLFINVLFIFIYFFVACCGIVNIKDQKCIYRGGLFYLFIFNDKVFTSVLCARVVYRRFSEWPTIISDGLGVCSACTADGRGQHQNTVS